jgi:hypothetical protein
MAAAPAVSTVLAQRLAHSTIIKLHGDTLIVARPVLAPAPSVALIAEDKPAVTRRAEAPVSEAVASAAVLAAVALAVVALVAVAPAAVAEADAANRAAWLTLFRSTLKFCRSRNGES